MSKHTSSIGTTTASAPRPGFQGIAALQATNRNASERYLLVFDRADAPKPGDVPDLAFPIPPAAGGSSGQIVRDAAYFTASGLQFKVGGAWALSTSPSSYVAANPADHTVTVVHV